MSEKCLVMFFCGYCLILELHVVTKNCIVIMFSVSQYFIAILFCLKMYLGCAQNDVQVQTSANLQIPDPTRPYNNNNEAQCSTLTFFATRP